MKYLIYARVSPKGSASRHHETSVAMQVGLCRQWVQGQGGAVAAVVEDEQESGKSLARPGMKQIMAELAAGAPWDAIVCYKLDRLTRSMADASRLFEELRDRGKGFVSLHEHMDLSSPFGRLQLHIIVAIAQFEREQTGIRTRDRMVQIAARGEWPCLPPYGYRRPRPRCNVLEPVPAEADNVRAIYARFAAKESLDALCRAYGLERNTVWRILHNPYYLGRIAYAGQEYPGRHQALIDPATWEAVRTRAPLQGPRPVKPERQKHVYLLAGRLYSPSGAAMSPYSTLGRGKVRYAYYQSTAGKADFPLVKAEAIEQAILEALGGIQLQDQEIARIVAAHNQAEASRQTQLAPRLAAASRALTAARGELRAAEDALIYAASPATAARLDARIAAAAQRVEELEEEQRELEGLSRGGSVPLDSSAIGAELRRLHGCLASAPPQEKRQIIADLVERIDIQAPGELALTLSWSPQAVRLTRKVATPAGFEPASPG